MDNNFNYEKYQGWNINLYFIFVLLIIVLYMVSTGAFYNSKRLDSCEGPYLLTCPPDAKCVTQSSKRTLYEYLNDPPPSYDLYSSKNVTYELDYNIHSGTCPRVTTLQFFNNEKNYFNIGIYEYHTADTNVTVNSVTLPGPCGFDIFNDYNTTSYFPNELPYLQSATNEIIKDTYNNLLLGDTETGACPLNYLLILKDYDPNMSTNNHNNQVAINSLLGEFKVFHINTDKNNKLHVHLDVNTNDTLGLNIIGGVSPIFTSNMPIFYEQEKSTESMNNKLKSAQNNIFEGGKCEGDTDNYCVVEPNICNAHICNKTTSLENAFKTPDTSFTIRKIGGELEKYGFKSKDGIYNLNVNTGNNIQVENGTLHYKDFVDEVAEGEEIDIDKVNTPEASYISSFTGHNPEAKTYSLKDTFREYNNGNTNPCTIEDSIQECNPFSFYYSDANEDDIKKKTYNLNMFTDVIDGKQKVKPFIM